MSGRAQHGFTLIELLVAAAIGGLILPVIVTSIFQMTRITARANKDFVVQLDIDTASSYFSRDLTQAKTTDLIDGVPANSMRVDWVDETGWAPEGAGSHFIEYTLSGTNLLRNYDGATSIAARRVADITFTRSGKFITVTIKSTLGGLERSLSYFVTPRADAAFQ